VDPSLTDTLARRREALASAARAEALHAVLITSPVNVTYLTGFSGDSSYLVLAGDRAILVSDGRFTTQIAEECPGLETSIRPPTQTVAQAAGAVLTKLGVGTAGFESNHLTIAEHEALTAAAPAVAWKPGKDRVEKLRQIKDAGEIVQIRAAIHIAERAFAMFRAFARAEDSEKELADALEAYVRRAGGKGTSFPPIVAVGERAALPHAPPTARRLGEAPLVLVDWGASGPFYKSDLTRVLLRNNNSPAHELNTKLTTIYEVVARAQREAIARVHPGVKAGDVDAAARGVIAQAGYADFFTHSTGHGLGLQVHEAPLLKPNADTLLEAGMVVTIEPGIYLPSIGGVRIEDDVLVTADGCEVLTHVPKDLESSRFEF
jgi:Xaa-Pro aminopeptidase